MNINIFQDGIILIKDLGIKEKEIFSHLKLNAHWDDSIKSRKTASYGIPYNYNNISYAYKKFPKEIAELSKTVKNIIGFTPNNCLINFYEFNESKMGFHADQIDILEPNTGIVIISIGSSRTMRFKNIQNKEIIFDIKLPSNSLCYMSQDIQNKWLHSILPATNTRKNERISITFRKIRDLNNKI